MPRIPALPDLPGLPTLPSVPSLPDLPSMAPNPHLVARATLDSDAIGNATPHGDAIVTLARRHVNVGEAYILGARVPMGNAAWTGPWDCAEFASWCVFQAAGILFGVEPRNDPLRADAYTGYWAQQARAAGAVVNVEEAAGIAGALVLREPQTGRTGHIVISDGQGGTLEAHSAKDGVIANTLSGRRWDYGILVPGIRYFASDAPVRPAPPPPDILRLKDPMMRGESVRRLQQRLTELGYFPGKVDGIFGPQTESAVAAFQAAVGQVVDGEFGPATRQALAGA